VTQPADFDLGHRTLPVITDAAHRAATGLCLDLLSGGPWVLTGVDHDTGRYVTTVADRGTVGYSLRLTLATTYPGVIEWQAAPPAGRWRVVFRSRIGGVADFDQPRTLGRVAFAADHDGTAAWAVAAVRVDDLTLVRPATDLTD
jgi:hypothetical protein